MDGNLVFEGIGRKEFYHEIVVCDSGFVDVAIHIFHSFYSVEKADFGDVRVPLLIVLREFIFDQSEIVFQILQLFFFGVHIFFQDRNVWYEEVFHSLMLGGGDYAFVSHFEEGFVDGGSFHVEVFGDGGCGATSEFVECEKDFRFFWGKAELCEKVGEVHLKSIKINVA